MQFGAGLVIALAAIMAAGTSLAATCDVDGDGDIDKLDLREISRARNTPASGPDDPRDANGDGMITPADVKACIPQCTLPGCEEPAASSTIDACQDPGAVDCNGSVTVDNTGFTTDPDDPAFSCHFAGPAQGVGSAWFTFVATETSACLDTNDSAVSDTLLAVYDGTCGALVELACSEDEGNGLLSELCVEGLTVGETYYVQVASFSAASLGSITLNTTCQPSFDCAAPGAVDCNGSVTIDNTDLTTEPDDPAFSCHFAGPAQGVGSTWFTFVATETSACLDTNDSAVSDTLLAVYDGTCGSLVELACSEDEGVGLLSELCVDGLTVGETYYVQAASFSAASLGSITVTTTCLPPEPTFDCQEPGAVDCNGSVTVDNTALTTDPGDPAFSCHFAGPAQGVGSTWFTFVATETSACLDTNLSAVSDTLLAVYDGTCGSLVELACSEDEGVGLLSELCVGGLTVGNTYYVQAASFSAASLGSITVTTTCSPP